MPRRLHLRIIFWRIVIGEGHPFLSCSNIVNGISRQYNVNENDKENVREHDHFLDDETGLFLL